MVTLLLLYYVFLCNRTGTVTGRELNSTYFSERFGDSLVRTPTYESCDSIDATDDLLTRRLQKVELTVTPQKKPPSSSSSFSSYEHHRHLQNHARRLWGGGGGGTDRDPKGGNEGSPKVTSATKAVTNLTPGIFPLLDPARFERRARGVDNAAVLIRGE